jgi:predicted nuclease of predicted toxin-antitoxin system
MLLWFDENLPRRFAPWIAQAFSVECHAIVPLGLERTPDDEIFLLARNAGAIILSKDADFVNVIERLGVPPQVILLTSGNTDNSTLKMILRTYLPDALKMIADGEPLVKIPPSAK